MVDPPFRRSLVSLSRLDLAVAIYAAITVVLAVQTAEYRPAAILAVAAPAVALVSRRRQMVVGITMIAGGLALGYAWHGLNPTDPLDLGDYAFHRFLAGQDPYGGHTYPTGTAYAYGPLGLLSSQLGMGGEILAATGIGAVLLWRRAWLTLALVSSVSLSVQTPFTGANDHVPTLLLLVGLDLLRFHPRAGALILALAVAVKPYAAAWMIPAVGFGGLAVAVVGAAASLVLWSPVLFFWGAGSYLESVSSIEEARYRQAAEGHSSWAIAEVPWVRYLAIPLALCGVGARSWRVAVLIGAAVFAVYLGFAPWANTAHLLPLIVTVGFALEAVDLGGHHSAGSVLLGESPGGTVGMIKSTS